MAMGLGACEKGLDNWQAPSDAELIERYIKHLDFCIKRDYPSVDYIEAHFEKGLLHRHGVWVNEEVGSSGGTRCVLNGRCTGALRYDLMSTQTVYVRHDSDVVIEARGMSRVWVHLYDSARIAVRTDELARVYVYLHGGEIVSQEGDVRVRERRKEVSK